MITACSLLSVAFHFTNLLFYKLIMGLSNAPREGEEDIIDGFLIEKKNNVSQTWKAGHTVAWAWVRADSDSTGRIILWERAAWENCEHKEIVPDVDIFGGCFGYATRGNIGATSTVGRPNTTAAEKAVKKYLGEFNYQESVEMRAGLEFRSRGHDDGYGPSWW